MIRRAREELRAGDFWMREHPWTVGLVGIGLGGAAVILVIALGLYTKATFEVKSACAKNPSGEACAKLRLDVARAEPIKNTCTPFRRVDRDGRLLRLTRCGNPKLTGSAGGELNKSTSRSTDQAANTTHKGGRTDPPSQPDGPSVPGQSPQPGPPSSEVDPTPPPVNESPGELTPTPEQPAPDPPASPQRGPLAPIVDPLVPPAAVPVVKGACDTAAELATPLC